MTDRPTVSRILVDVDSTLHPMSEQFIRLLAKHNNVRIGVTDIDTWDFWSRYITLPQLLELFDRCHADDEVLSRVPYPGAVAAIAGWMRQGAEIHVVTDRTARATAATRTWLDRIGLGRAVLEVGPRVDKARYIVDHGITLAIDDKPAFIEQLLRDGTALPATIEHPYNRPTLRTAGARVVHAAAWPELARRIEARVTIGVPGRRAA